MCHTVSPPVNDVIILVCYTGDIRLTVILLDNPGKLLEALCDYALYKSTFSYITLHYISRYRCVSILDFTGAKNDGEGEW